MKTTNTPPKTSTPSTAIASTTSAAAAGLLANIKALKRQIEDSGLPTHQYFTFNGQQAAYLSRASDGSDKILALGSRMILNLPYLMHGYVCWKGGKVHDQVGWPMLATAPIPNINALPDHGPYEDADENKRDGWRYQITLPFKDVTTGVSYFYKTGSDSSVRSTQSFVHKVLSAASAHEPGAAFPVIVLARGNFVPKGRTNKVHIPKFDLETEWMPAEKADMGNIKMPDGVFMLQEEAARGGADAQPLVGAAIKGVVG